MDYFDILADHSELFPESVVSLCEEMQEKFAESGLSYNDCNYYCKRLEKLGWTFEYGLDAEPYGLRPKLFKKYLQDYTKDTNGYLYGIELRKDQEGGIFWIANLDFEVVFSCEAFDNRGEENEEVKEAKEKYGINPPNGLTMQLGSVEESKKTKLINWKIDKYFKENKFDFDAFKESLKNMR